MRCPYPAGLVMLCVLTACQPALNWREVQPPGAAAVASFPCKPDFDVRPAQGGQGAMGLAQCEAGGLGFSLSWADAPSDTPSGAALQAMVQALAAKLGQPLPGGAPLVVAGMTPWPQAQHYRWQTAAGVTHVAVFAHGQRVYQALMTGGADDAAAWAAFVAGLRVGSAV